MLNKTRCSWANNKLNIKYHDKEWGVALHNDQKLFELLILEGAQAGLSWDLILSKRANYINAFSKFKIKTVAKFDQAKIDDLLLNKGIIRNKLKINSAVKNAKATLKIIDSYGSFDRYIWTFTNNKTIHNKWNITDAHPTTSALSDKISKDLKQKGFNFVGSTIIYSFIQAVGIVNDHTTNCFRYKELLHQK